MFGHYLLSNHSVWRSNHFGAVALMGDIKRSGSSGWKNGSHKKIKSRPQLTKNLLIVRCRLAFDGVMGFLCINSSLKTDCFHFLKNDNPQKSGDFCGPRSQTSGSYSHAFRCASAFQCLYDTSLVFLLRGWGKIGIHISLRPQFPGDPGEDCCVGLIVKRWWYIW